jgi:NAD(P)H-flavin reductase
MKTNDLYIPLPSEIVEIKEQGTNIKSFLVKLPKEINSSEIMPGQFFEISVFGQGEAPISISDVFINNNTLLFCVANVGTVTEKLHSLKAGSTVGIRGPFGNGFPMSSFKGKNLILLGGGIGLAPLRAVASYFFDNVESFGKLELLYGARSSKDLIYKDELKQWRLKANTIVKISIDKPEKDWKGNVGFVTSFLDPNFADRSEILFNNDKEFKETKLIICGPPPMINTTIKTIEKLNFPQQEVFIALENRMKCGMGKCGHCNIGSKYVCLDGPIFTLSELKQLPKEF